MNLDWCGRNVMVAPSATAKSIQKSLEIGREKGAPGAFSIAETSAALVAQSDFFLLFSH